MEPLVLAGVTVASTVCISIVLVAFFLLREEKFEDHLAHQTEQDAAIFTRSTSAKVGKSKVKPVKRKKKHSENEGEGVGGGHEVEESPANDSSIAHQDSTEKPKSILKEKKNKSKKQASAKAEAQAAKERHTHFEDEPQPVVEEAVFVQESVAVEAALSEPEPKPVPVVVVEEELLQDVQTSLNAEPQAPKKTKNKTKPPKEKPQAATGEVGSNSLLNTLKTANLNATELQDFIDVLLNKQGEHSQWKSTTKGDETEMLKKQLQEKEQLIMEEKKQSLNAANKLKEMRDEIQQERMKQKAQFTVATNKITAQSKELQAMQARMKATHDGHSQEVQTLQTQLQRFQEMVNSSSMTTVQRLQEENAQLKNASMRASQLTADKESLTGELHKLQQSHRQVKSDLATRMEQLQQMEGHRQVLEKQVHDAKLQHGSKQEAEKVLNKRLSEVNDELKKAEAREAKLNQAMEEQLQKCKTLTEHLNKAENGKASEADSMNALTSKLTEATNRVSELEKMFTSVETQLRESQEQHAHKDQEIKGLKDELHQTKETDEPKTNAISMEMQNSQLEEKTSAISNLNEQLNKQNEEITNLKNTIEQEKKKNNDLRTKNWKAMEALSATEQSIKSDIAKAVQAAKAEAKEEAAHNMSSSNETLEELSKVKEELENTKEEMKKVEEIVGQQKKKNNDLREKNWKAMDAVSEAEKSASGKVKAAVENIKKTSLKDMESERVATKNVLVALYPEITVESTLSFEKWLSEFQQQASVAKPTIVENGDISSELEESKREMEQLKAECSHYKNGLEDTESMLRKLENHIETEIGNWENKLEVANQEALTAKSKIGHLEHELSVAQSSSESHLEKINSIEKDIATARQNDSNAKAKISSLEKELSNSSNKLGDISRLEKELLQSKENGRKMHESLKKYESVQVELSRTVQQMSEVQGQLTTRDSEVKSLRQEIKRNQESGEDFKKKVAYLEEALSKANNDVGKSQESINSENSGSPDKKKKGIKGAFSKLTHGSKKDKESKNADKEEAKQILTYKTEIEELKAELKKAKDSEMTRSQQIEKDVAEAMADAAAAKAAAENNQSSV